jgi:hypothetical protein
MSGRRWKLWLGPPIAVMAIALALSRWQAGAEAGGRVTPRPAGVCAGATPVAAGAEASNGTWWKLSDRLDGAGTLVGRTLFAGSGKTTKLALELDAESMASGPVGGLVVVSSDDGRFSEIRIVAAAEGCSWLIHRGEAVVRSALLDRATGSILAHLLQRETRADLGTWRISGMDPDAAPGLVLGPLQGQADLGPIWATELRLDATGRTLAVQSCSDLGCVTRVVALAGTGKAPVLMAGADQGSIVGFAGRRLVTWALCAGLPCALQAWDPGTGGHDTLVVRAEGAGLTADGRYLLAVVDTSTGRALRVDLAGSVAKRVGGILAGDVPLRSGVGASAGIEVRSDELALGSLTTDAHPFNPGRAAVIP